MNLVVRRIGILSLAAALTGLAGCGGSQGSANRSAYEKIAQAEQELTDHQLDQALTDSAAAAQTEDISPDVAARAQYLQGQIKAEKARQFLVQAQAVEVNVNRLVGEIRLATGRVASAQSQIQSDANLDPSPTIDILKKQIADAQGGDNQAEWPSAVAGNASDQATLHSLAGLDAEIARLQAAVQANRDQAKQFGDQRTEVLGSADQLQQKSLSDTGQQSVSDVGSAAEQRRKAAEIEIQIDKLDAAVVHLQADLANYQVQRAGTQQVLADYQKQIDDLDLSWKSAQQDIEAQKQAVLAIAGPAASSTPPAETDVPLPTTIADQCAALKQLVADDRGLRDQAATAFNGAIQSFKAAGSAGDQVRSTYSDRLSSPRVAPMETLAVQQLDETFSGSDARLRMAEAEQDLAVNYAAGAMVGAQVKSAMTGAQSALGSDTPPAVADCLASVATPSVDDLAQSAEEQFKNAMDDFDNQNVQTLQGNGPEVRKTMGLVGKMIAAFGAKQLSLAMGDKPVAGRTPTELQGMIDDLANQVAQRDPTALPAIPYTLAPPTATPQ